MISKAETLSSMLSKAISKTNQSKEIEKMNADKLNKVSPAKIHQPTYENKHDFMKDIK